MLYKRLSLLVLSLLLTLVSVILAARYSKSEASVSVNEAKMKVLRRKGHLKI